MFQSITRSLGAVVAAAAIMLPAQGIAPTSAGGPAEYHLCIQRCNINFQAELAKCTHKCKDRCLFKVPILGCVVWTEDTACVESCQALAAIEFQRCMQLCALTHPIGQG